MTSDQLAATTGFGLKYSGCHSFFFYLQYLLHLFYLWWWSVTNWALPILYAMASMECTLFFFLVLSLSHHPWSIWFNLILWIIRNISIFPNVSDIYSKSLTLLLSFNLSQLTPASQGHNSLRLFRVVVLPLTIYFSMPSWMCISVFGEYNLQTGMAFYLIYMLHQYHYYNSLNFSFYISSKRF